MSEALFGFIGVIVGSIVPWVREHFRDKKLKKDHSVYLAVQVICVLDEYVEKCRDVVGDDGTIMGQPAGRAEEGQEFYTPQVLLPECPSYPADVDWKSIDNGLMYRILALPNMASKIDRYISASSEHAFPPDYDELFQARQDGYARLGLEAISIAEELRRTYKLPIESFQLNQDWSYKKYLQDRISNIRESE